MAIPHEIHAAFDEFGDLDFSELMYGTALFVGLGRNFCLARYYAFENFVLDTCDEIRDRDPSCDRSGATLVGLIVLVVVLSATPGPVALMVVAVLLCEMVKLLPEMVMGREWDHEYDEEGLDFEHDEEGLDFEHDEEGLDFEHDEGRQDFEDELNVEKR
ncbi:hypothetical protein G647_10287 [Cladophialophora carrionii CBS 160.54]|uniref:Uncharacterized protein n=1 Tax=Cladophialophora carrionii CBS 160.54 TaxID=1279043 RepID=V9DJE6_9EURO|nr:uncharacterized protein G647_10287 [Cladophialophora carrionii CBS 160.54]ETI26841.1 hypothetical protein G647_10287 [Cladophialophora carrionii CBS 160.54]